MKKLLLASLITAASFGANASSVINFDDSTFGGSGSIDFDRILFAADTATVFQEDADGNGSTFGPAEPFNEFGTATAVIFQLGAFGFTGIPAAYQVFYDYSFAGEAVYTPSSNEIDVTFSSGVSGIYVDQDMTAGLQIGGATKVADLNAIPGGVCDINLDSTGSGRCEINLVVDFVAGYFENTNGEDLASTGGVKVGNLIVTIDEVDGFSTTYVNPGDIQDFTVVHQGNITFDVPEPSSIAILGLGLLGFAGAARRRKA